MKYFPTIYVLDHKGVIRYKDVRDDRMKDAVELLLDDVPAKKGRWGQWDGITTLAQWLPVVAVHDDMKGWQPAPFIPWHQPFHQEAGRCRSRMVRPSRFARRGSRPA